MSTNRLLKKPAGRHCEQKALRKRFLAQPDGQHAVRRVLRSQHSFSSAICVYSRLPAVALAKEGSSAVKIRFGSLFELISAYKCSSVVKIHEFD
jgi:hypothetical protein